MKSLFGFYCVLLYEFENFLGFKKPSERYIWINPWILTNQGSWVEDDITSNLGPISNDCSELFQFCIEGFFIFENYIYAFSIEPKVWCDSSSCKMSLRTKNGVSNVIEVRNFTSVENDWFFDLGTVSDNDVITHDCVAP